MTAMTAMSDKKVGKNLTVISGGTSEETLLDKVKLLSDAIVALKEVVSDLKSSLAAEKDKFDQLLDQLGMSRLDCDSFKHTGKLPTHLQGRRECDNPQLKMDADDLLESVGLSRRQYELSKEDGKINWDLSDLGRALNNLTTEIEKETDSLNDSLEEL
jgi:hypothetical protein